MDLPHTDASAQRISPVAGLHERRELFDAASRVLRWHARRTQEAQRRWLSESGFVDEEGGEGIAAPARDPRDH